MEVDPGGGKKTMIVKKMVAFSNREKERILQEIELYKKLEKNDFVIDLIAHIVDEINHFLLFKRYSLNFSEYLESLKNEENVDELKHLKYFSGIVSAIEELHSFEYAHLDIKPANIMKTENEIKMIDFGSATKMPIEIKTSSDHHKHREDAEELCSMMYRAPELFNCEIGSTLTTAVDVWALGICLYEFMYLENPFNKIYEQGGSIALATQSPHMIKWNTGERQIREETIELIKSVLIVNPAQRPSASEFKSSVDTLIETWNQKGTDSVDTKLEISEDNSREITDEEFDLAMRQN
uniref:non-specific serine/threonine protein kinase n=1 Tax=Caenorhabditis tropicalis TaxID=1561998 RepID=A0A1I7TME7_9PELO